MTDIGTNNKSNRNAWLQKTLAQIPAGQKILDAGAGELANKKYCGHLEYVSQDFDQYNGQGDGQGLQCGTWANKSDIVSDITSIPEPNASYDAILCSEVFEHLFEPIEAVKEFSRLIRPEGTLVLTAPVSSLTHQSPHYYYNGFSRYWYEKVLDRCGFDIKELSYNGNYFTWMAQEARRISDVSIKHVEHKINLQTLLYSKYHRPGFEDQLPWMEAMSRDDTGSEQLLAYGIHVVAVKR